jgi:acyl carrier protein
MAMTKEDVVEQLHEVLCEEFELEPEQLTGDAHLYRDLDLDSLDAVDLMVALYRTFGVKVDEADARKIETVSGLEDYVCRKAEEATS